MVEKGKYSVDKLPTHKLGLHVLIGLVAGVITGLLLPYITPLAATISDWLALPGYIFLNLIRMIVLPLVLTSVFLGVSGCPAGTAPKLGAAAILYFSLTTLVAITIGMGLMMYLHPGIGFSFGSIVPDTTTAPLFNQMVSPAKVIANFIPVNIFASLSKGDMLATVIFAAFCGAAALALPAQYKTPLVTLAESVQHLTMVVVGWAMALAPLAVFGLVCNALVTLGHGTLQAMASYMLTILLGLAGVLAMYILLLVCVGRMPARQFFAAMRPVQLVAFSTSSSAATMPLTLNTVETKLGVSPAVSRMIIPLGTTINMDGTALYQAAATVFIAQAFAIDLSHGELLLLVFTALAAAIGTPGTPGVGIVLLASILMTVGVPAEGIALIVGVDRVLDMCRTVINVTGDAVASIVLARLLGRPSHS